VGMSESELVERYEAKKLVDEDWKMKINSSIKLVQKKKEEMLD